jgi:general secretion pathway protein B
VPSLAINVYAFTNEVADRFVMIDRVKYKVGQRINEELELKEIRVDSIVVNYNNRTFKIRRP